MKKNHPVKSFYDIEFYMEKPVDRWTKFISFSYMQKSFAEGAWAMLKSFYNHDKKHRLIRKTLTAKGETKNAQNKYEHTTRVIK